jgi:hypothetical protein
VNTPAWHGEETALRVVRAVGAGDAVASYDFYIHAQPDDGCETRGFAQASVHEVHFLEGAAVEWAECVEFGEELVDV